MFGGGLITAALTSGGARYAHEDKAISANGVYMPDNNVRWDKVTVELPIAPLNVTTNGTYNAADYSLQGFDPVNVNVPNYEDENKRLKDIIDTLINPEDHPEEITDSNGNPVIDPDGNPIVVTGAIKYDSLDEANETLSDAGATAAEYYFGSIKFKIIPNENNPVYTIGRPILEMTYLPTGETEIGYVGYPSGLDNIKKWRGIQRVLRMSINHTPTFWVLFTGYYADGTAQECRLDVSAFDQPFNSVWYSNSPVYVVFG